MLESVEVSVEDGTGTVDFSGDNGPTQIPDVSVAQQEQQNTGEVTTLKPAKINSITGKPLPDTKTTSIPPQNDEISLDGEKTTLPPAFDGETTIRLLEEGVNTTPMAFEGTPMTQKSANTMVSFSFFLYLWSPRLYCEIC